MLNCNSLKLKSEQDFCKITETSLHDLHRIIENIKSHYYTFQIPKINGTSIRVITPPSEDLKLIQYKIKWYIEERIKWPNYLHGGIPGCSILTNSQPHVGKYMVANLDIKDFFPNTTPEMIIETLCRFGCSYKLAWLIACLVTYKGGLPQGAPTSTLLANLVFHPIDKRFLSFCTRRDLSYSRYVDDITISGDRDLRPFKDAFCQFIEEGSYLAANEKIRFTGRNEPQVVTGLVVNDKIRPTRNFIRDLKKDIRDSWPEALGVEVVAALRGLSVCQLRKNLWGRINFLKSVDRKLGREVRGLLTKIVWPRPKIQAERKAQFIAPLQNILCRGSIHRTLLRCIRRSCQRQMRLWRTSFINLKRR